MPRRIDLPEDFLARIVKGSAVAFDLPDGRKIACEAQQLETDAKGVVQVSGTFEQPSPGSFFFRRQDFEGTAGKLVGHVIFDGQETAWKVLPEGNNGDPVLKEVPIGEVVCVKFMPQPTGAEEMPQDHTASVPLPSYQAVIPLQSLPVGAGGTIYLDFDGSKPPYAGWSYSGNASHSGLSNSTIRDIWIRVAEDWIPFNINVTTDAKVYEKAPQGRRIRCIVTPTNFYGAGGIAFVGSYGWGGDPVCWASNYTGDGAVTVISHEVGHTFGLRHHGQGSAEYYGGQGSGVTAWAPIMGAGYGRNLKHWSRGDYYLATRPGQNDLATISSRNGIDFRTDDCGSTLAAARHLWIAPNATVTDQEGIIETTGDVDAFRFKTSGGAVNLTAITSSPGSNLDILAQLTDASTGAVVATADVASTLSANISTTLPAGEYLFTITGTGYGDPANLTGYSNYGSIGSYSISGTVANAETHQAFIIPEHSAAGTVVGTIAPRTVTGGPLTYAIASGNTGGALTLDATTGVLTVASASALNYETLSTRYDVPALLELTVNITNPATSATEAVRALVTVSDINEAPTLDAFATDMTILEGTAAGTPVVQLAGTDADRFDLATFEIVSGNSAGVFAINASTGWITVANPPDPLATPSVTLTVRSRDQNATPMYSATRNITITVAAVSGTLPGTPGSIVRTFFRNVTGATVADLTASANFPNKPDEEVFLTSFDGGASQGDNYGSTIRGWLIPPATGDYQFWVSSDDASQLILGSGPAQVSTPVIASVTGSTSQYAWDAQASAASAVIPLTVGQPYYIELRQKEGSGGDHAAVAWSGPGISRQIIPGLFLAPFYQNYAPKLTGSFKVGETAAAGTVIGRPTVTDVNKPDAFGSYAITGGNSAGLFAINPTTGDITLAAAGQFNVLTKPYYDLTISVTDDGTPPLVGTGVVRVTIEPNQLYFDPNGTAAGSVADGGSYAWRTTSWAAGTGGTRAVQAWISNAQAFFSATSPTGPLAYDIDIASYNSGSHGGFSAIRSLAGTVRFTGNVDNFYLTGPLVVAAAGGSSIVFNHTRTSAALQAFNLNGNTATFDGDVTFNTCGMGNSGNVVVAGGNLTLNAANIYTGSTTINGGTLALRGSGTLYATLAWGNQTVLLNSGASLEVDRWASANRSLGQLGYGPQNLVIDGGTLRYTGLTNPVETNNGPAFTIGVGGATLESATAGQTWRILLDARSNFVLVNNGGDITLTGAGDGEITKVIPGVGAQLIKTGTGAWTLSAANTYDGGTIVRTGTLRFNSPASLPGAVTIESNSNNESLVGTLVMNAGATTWSQNVTGSGRWQVATGTGSQTTVLAGDYSGFTGALEVATGGGKIQLATAAKYPAAGSSLDLAANTTAYITGGGTLASRILMRGGSIGEPTYGQLRIGTASATLTGGITLLAGTTIAVDSSRTATVTGAITESGGSFGLTKNQPGILVVTAANTYTGGTTVASGTLQTGAASGTFGSGDLNVASGATARILHAGKALGRQAFVRLNGTGKLELAAGVAESVARLYIDGVLKPAGTYSAANLPASISGAGSLVVGESLPEVPTTLATSLASWNSVLLTWSHLSVNETDLRIERSLSATGGFVEIATLTPGTSNYVDAGLAPLTTFFYRIRVKNALGFSPYSGVVQITTRAVDRPTGLATAVSSGRVDLTWTLNPDAAGYLVKRGTVSGGPYTQLGTPTAASFSDTTVANGTEYFYIVTATASGAESDPSDEVAARPIPPAGNGTWTADSGGNWSAAENWQDYTVADGAGNSATFAQPGGGVVTIDTALRTLGGVAFSGGNYAITGGALTLDAASAVPVVSVGAGATATVSAPVSGADGLQKTGAGRLILTADSGIAGNTTVSAGTLTHRGFHASNAFDIAAGAVFEIDSTAGSMDHAATTFTGAGTLRKSGANRINWGTASANFSLASGALIDVQGGTFTGGSNANEVWTNNRADLNVAAGAVFDGVEANVRVDGISGNGTIKTGYSGGSYTGLTIGVDNGSSTFGGVIANSSSTGNLTKAGNGTITLAGSNTFTGAVAVSAGTLRITRSGGLGTGNKTVSLNAAADKMLELDGSGGNIAVAAGISYRTSGSNGVIRNLAGNNTIAGAITMDSTNGNTRIISDGGMLTLGGNITATTTGRVLDLGGTSAGNNTVSGAIESTNTPSVLKTGPGTWVLSGANSYNGTTAVSAGTLTLSGNRTGTSGAITVSNVASTNATLNIQAGTHALGANAFSVASAPTTPAAGTVNQSGGEVSFTGGNALLLGNGNIANTASYNLSGGSITTFASTARGIILGTNTNSIAAFTLSGNGSLNLTAASGASGDGVLQVGRYDSSGTTATTATFTQTGGTANVGILSVGGNGASGSASNATLTLTGGIFSANQFPRLAAGNTNTVSMTIGGTADVTLPAFPTARGTGSTATLTFDGGTLRPLAASTAFLGGLTNTWVRSGGATFDVPSGLDITVAQILQAHAASSGGVLTKNGAGNLTLSAANTYNGGTVVNAGSLVIGAAGKPGTGPLTVNAGATCDLRNTAGAISDNATISLNGTGKLIIAAGVAETVARLYVNSAIQPGGTYTAASHPALISDSGSLIVTTGLPVAPATLSATAVSSSTINLTWADNDGGESAYLVERSSTSGSGFSQIASLSANSTAYADTGLSANATWFYRVRATGGSGNSTYSNVASATTLPTPPPAPTSPTATAGGFTVRLEWAAAANATGYRIKRSSTSGGVFTQVGTTSATSFIDAGLTPGVPVFYQIAAENSGSVGADSGEVTATPLAALQWDAADTATAGAQGGNGTWSSAALWWNGFADAAWPVTGPTNEAVFGGAAGVVGLDPLGVAANRLTFNTNGYFLRNGSLTFNGTSPGVFTASGVTAEIASPISGSAGLTKSGPGSLVLSGSNSYGATFIQQGLVQVNAGGTLGGVTANVTLGTGAAGAVGTVGNLIFNTSATVGVISVVSNTTDTTTPSNIGQLTVAAGTRLTASGLTAGVASSSAGSTRTALATGAAGTGGTLAVNGNVLVGASGSTGTTITSVDLSGLSGFVLNAPSGWLRIGYGALTKGMLTLPAASTLNAASISVGETVSSGNSGQFSTLSLGSGSTVIQTNDLRIGFEKTAGVVQFAGPAGSVSIAGVGGAGKAAITVGSATGGTYGGAGTNSLLLAGHDATVAAGTVVVGRKGSGSSGGNIAALLTFDTGTFTADEIQIGIAAAGSNGTTASGTFTLGANATSTGNLTVSGNFILASNTNSTNAQAASGTFIINGGTASISGTVRDTSTTTVGTSNTTLTLDGGTLDMKGNPIGGDGTPGNLAIKNLNFRSGTLKNVAEINGGAAGLTKSTAGTLTLAGNHTFTGPTVIAAGRLVLDGALAGNLTASGGTFVPAGASSINGTLDIPSGGRLEAVPGITLAAGGNVTLAGALDLIPPDGLSVGDTFILVAKTGVAAVAGTFAGLPEGSVFVAGGHPWKITYAGGDGNDVAVTLLTGQEAWRKASFGTTANTGTAADGFDANSDGESNLLEFAAGQDPNADTLFRPSLAISGSVLEFVYPRGKQASADGFGFIVEWSDSLLAGSWSSTGVSERVISGNATVESVQASVPAGSGSKRFVRVRIVAP